MIDKFEEILNRKAESPTPLLKADPFLSTRIKAMSQAATIKRKTFRLVYEWSMASLVTSCAVLFGIYLGSSLFEAEQSVDALSDLSGSIYQQGYFENLDSVIEKGSAD